MQLVASLGGALVGCAGLASLFVGSLYLVPAHLRHLAHGDPRQIKARFAATAGTCVGATAGLLGWALASRQDSPGGLAAPSFLSLLGLRLEGLVPAIILPLGLMAMLFAGPLLNLHLKYKRKPPHAHTGDFLFDFFPNCPEPHLQRLRNVVIAPLAEELVFRSCMGALLTAGGLSLGKIVLFSPLFFGTAHLHHCYGMVREGTPLRQALIVSAVQFTYTSMFGALEMFIFLRTGHLAAVFVAHAWCNLLGLPSLEWLSTQSLTYPYRHSIGIAFLAGVAGFALALKPLTSPSLYGGSIFWR